MNSNNIYTEEERRERGIYIYIYINIINNIYSILSIYPIYLSIQSIIIRNGGIIMFNLTKELDEVKLEYFIIKRSHQGLIALTLTDIANLLGVNKSKAQRLIEKFIKLNILTIESKSTSKNTKTIYRYNCSTNINTYVDTNKCVNINEYVSETDTNKETKDNISIDICALCEQKFKRKVNSHIKKELKLHEGEVDRELIEYLVDDISNRDYVTAKDKYLLNTLDDMKTYNVKTIEDYYKYTENHKKAKDIQKRTKNWNYTPSKDEWDIDFEHLAEMTRYR